MPKNTVKENTTMPVAKPLPVQEMLDAALATIGDTTDDTGAYRIEVLKGDKWVVRDTISHTPKGRPLKNANDALKYGYGVYGTRPRMGEATSKSGKRFRAVKVA